MNRRPHQLLEPCAGKLARTVLRGAGRGNTLRLPDWPVRTLRKKGEGGHNEPQTPAMVAGLTDHVWTIQEGATYPARKCIRDK